MNLPKLSDQIVDGEESSMSNKEVSLYESKTVVLQTMVLDVLVEGLV